METFSDKTRAYVYALLVHLVVFASLFVGLLWTREATPIAVAGPVIEATIVGKPAAPAPRPQAKPTPAPPKPADPPPAPAPPQPVKPDPTPPTPPAQAKPPPTVQRNDNTDQEKIAEIAEQKAEDAKRAQEEKRRQQQILLDEEKKRDEAESKEKARQEEIQKQLADVRKQQAALRKQVLAEQKVLQNLDLKQQQQQQPPAKPPSRSTPADLPEAEKPVTGMNGTDTSKLAAYYSAIQLSVTNNWLRPENAPPGLTCRVHIIQIPGGNVISATVIPPCDVDQATRSSIEQAVMKASPLPYQTYEKEFKREINLDFSYGGK